jgi:hypothetical protein
MLQTIYRGCSICKSSKNCRKTGVEPPMIPAFLQIGRGLREQEKALPDASKNPVGVLLTGNLRMFTGEVGCGIEKS